MDLTDIDSLKNFLSRFRIRPNDRLSQNFLVDAGVLEDIVSAAGLTRKDTVLEIGPGIGTLTARLAVKAGEVIAVEKDRRFLKPLAAILNHFHNVKIINDDILKANLPQLIAAGSEPPDSFKVVANIPYSITGEILRFLLSFPVKPKAIVLLVQKEVAQRITASDGGHSLLSLSVQYFATPEIIRFVGKKSFFPVPEVDSAILRIIPRARAVEIPEKSFFRLARIGFSARRKTLANNLAAGFKISKAEIIEILNKAQLKSACRAQELGLEDWKRLHKSLGRIATAGFSNAKNDL